MTFYSDGLNRKNFLVFLEVFEPDDWVTIEAVREVFGASEDKVVRLVVIMWMYSKIEWPEDIGNHFSFRLYRGNNLTIKESEPDDNAALPVAGDETIQARLARLTQGVNSVVIADIIKDCESCGESFSQSPSAYPAFVCKNCKGKWREKYVTRKTEFM